MDQAKNEQADGAPGTVTLGGRSFLVASPTPADKTTIFKQFHKMAKAKLRSPMAVVREEWEGLTAEQREMLVAVAMKQQVGDKGEKEPTQDHVNAQIYTPEGCAFQLWVLAGKFDPTLKLEDVSPLITEDNVINVLADLAEAFKPKNSTGPTGGGQSTTSTGQTSTSDLAKPT